MHTTTNTQAEHTVTSASDKSQDRPTFYTVAEAAQLLRVDPATIYRAIRADAFPAVRVRSRYVIPAMAVDQMAEQAAMTGACVDVAAIATARRIGREVARMIGGKS
jgi:excisionase family DNA binding protein